MKTQFMYTEHNIILQMLHYIDSIIGIINKIHDIFIEWGSQCWIPYNY